MSGEISEGIIITVISWLYPSNCMKTGYNSVVIVTNSSLGRVPNVVGVLSNLLHNHTHVV